MQRPVAVSACEYFVFSVQQERTSYGIHNGIDLREEGLDALKREENPD